MVNSYPNKSKQDRKSSSRNSFLPFPRQPSWKALWLPPFWGQGTLHPCSSYDGKKPYVDETGTIEATCQLLKDIYWTRMNFFLYSIKIDNTRQLYAIRHSLKQNGSGVTMEFPKCSDMKNRSNESLSFRLRFHWSSVDCLLTYMIASVFFSKRSYKAQRIQSCISFLKELWLLDRLSTSIFSYREESGVQRGGTNIIVANFYI
jgi:hypothetical protein